MDGEDTLLGFSCSVLLRGDFFLRERYERSKGACFIGQTDKRNQKIYLDAGLSSNYECNECDAGTYSSTVGENQFCRLVKLKC